jgi:hypothetical protein
MCGRLPLARLDARPPGLPRRRRTLRGTVGRLRLASRQRAHASATDISTGSRLAFVPDIEIYAVDVSFSALQDKAERDYLNDLPRTVVAPAAARPGP